MKNQIKVTSKFEIQELLSKEISKLIESGFVINRSYTHETWPHIELNNSQGEEVCVIVERNHLGWEAECNHTLELKVNNETMRTFYSLTRSYYSKYTEEKSIITEISKIRNLRKLNQYISPYSRNITSENTIKGAKSIAGFKTVPKKNIRVIKVNSPSFFGYKIQNVTTKNEKLIGIKKK